MVNFLKSIGAIIIGICIFFMIIFLTMFFVKGGVWLGALVLPWLSIFMRLVFILNVIIFLPLGIFKKTRSFSAFGFVMSSFVYGLTLWFWALLLTYLIWGTRAVFIGLLIAGVGVVPISVFATALNGQWAVTGEIILFMVLTYGSRMLGFYLAEKVDDINS